MAQAIITKFLAATNTLGPRVVAKSWNSKVTVGWDYRLDIIGNHRAAAEELIKKLNAKAGVEFEILAGGELPDQSGYAFIIQ
ncbi:hypothetical protein [Enterobacteria phage JenP1]|uniref:Uncharacterized protein n=1 Tax=Enterobacteria phage JenP1 TaxID=1610837 RepID=A0A0E3JPU6_9CAUD|nr:hypothetical protein AVU34_gp72 [Enterobacteria phage JenP1]AKA60938.1 hypothetical protein [Enterobacteria phage JenP1]